MVFPLLTSDGAYDRSAILQDALGLHHRSRGTFWAGAFSLSYCLRGTWGRARRQKAQHRSAAAHALLFDLLQDIFAPPESGSLALQSTSPSNGDAVRCGA